MRNPLATSVLMGLTCGVILFGGETLVSVLSHDQMFLPVLLVTALVDILIGACIGFLSWLLRGPLGTLMRSVARGRHVPHELLLIPLLVNLLHGGVLLKYSLLAGADVSPLEIAMVLLVWVFLCALLYLCLLRTFGNDSRLLAPKLALGLFLSVTATGFLSIAFKPSFDTGSLQILLDLAVIISACAISYLAAAFLLGAARRVPIGSTRLRTGGTLAALVLTAFLVFLLALRTRTAGDREGGSQGASLPTSQRPNVILIVLDTLRADHLSCYGYERKTSPRIDALAQEAIKFDNCYSTANWTVPGHASIFTGKYSVSHGAHKSLSESASNRSPANPFFCYPLSQEELTLAEILKGEGYQTAAIISNFGCVTPMFGLDQGFDFFFNKPSFTYRSATATLMQKTKFLFDEIGPYQSRFRLAETINGEVFDWLDGERQENVPFFLFINYMDTHDPYFPPPAYQRLYPGKIPGRMGDVHIYGERHLSVSEEEKQHLISQYDGEIAYLDESLARLLAKVKAEGLFEESVIVVTSDHGEYLGEHTLYGHSIGLYNPVLKVPLLIKPHAGCGHSLDSSMRKVVQTIDILPTILTILDIPLPEGIQGNSLTGDVAHPIVAEHDVGPGYRSTFGGRFASEHTALIEDGYKLILSKTGDAELFNLSEDPGETENLAGSREYLSLQLSAAVEEWRNSVTVKDLETAPVPELDEESLRNLKALGYMQ
jgi:arylsulfatase A-like enzyme